MIAWTQVYSLSKPNPECLLVFYFQSGVLFGFGMTIWASLFLVSQRSMAHHKDTSTIKAVHI